MTQTKKAEWQYKDYYGMAKCSNCGAEYYIPWHDQEWWNFCPNCGADMRGNE